jgi:bifunctional non-homologous end joining protein LigD
LVEPEWSGYRALLRVAKGQASLSSRLNPRLEKQFPTFTKQFADCEAQLLLDGFLVFLGEDGKPRRKGDGGGNENQFIASDILHWQGVSTRELPLAERKQLLAGPVAKVLKKLPAQINEVLTIDALQADEEDAAIVGLLARATNGTYDEGDAFAQPIRHAREVVAEDIVTVEAEDVPTGRAKLHPPKEKATRRALLTNPTKIFWPSEGYTKQDVFEYYKAVAPFMLPHIKDRPQSLNRHPNGIDGKSFFQKEITGHIPRWMHTVEVEGGSGRSINYALVQDAESLLFLANMGCIEINVWNSRWQTIEFPDYLIIDIDPGQIDFAEVIATTLLAREVLDKMQVTSFVKTSGGRGMHVYVPIKPKFTHTEVRSVALEICKIIHAGLPKTTSLERTPAKRTKKIYLDFLQNRRGSTMAAPYAARPRPGAAVSMPLAWSEVTKKLNPLDYTIKTALKRVERYGDGWQRLFDNANDFNKLKAQVAKMSQQRK